MKIGGSGFETFDFQIAGDDKKSMIKSKVSASCNFTSKTYVLPATPPEHTLGS